ncbi:hypothetical protein EAG_12819 [Camponotus floridanus]|uniref:Uncharacterized protein n=1 Tax=Camponotus floridanus TaxID=104421 RepID=E2AT35_CAMFO|nr:hypothetical protein EAG_12819 [Camponotus floridanus]
MKTYMKVPPVTEKRARMEKFTARESNHDSELWSITLQAADWEGRSLLKWTRLRPGQPAESERRSRYREVTDFHSGPLRKGNSVQQL